MKKITVTIGIPAYNEEKNIGKLIHKLLKQHRGNFILKEIIVYSDASSDKTNEIVRAVKNPLIKLIVGKKRSGVATGQNVIFSKASGDIAIVINADSAPYVNNFLETLVSDYQEDYPDLIGAKIKELPPKNFLERVLYTSMIFKGRVFDTYKSGDHVFTCHGNCRVFSKRFYKDIYFPQSVGEDMYSYLYCVKKRYKYSFAKNAEIYYKLPDNMADHQKQSIRFYRSTDWLKKELGDSYVNKHIHVPLGLCVKYGLKTLFEHPIEMSTYLLIVYSLYIKSLFYPIVGTTNTWAIATSSKTLANKI